MTFYRCALCNSVVTKWDIENLHACPKCGQVRIMPTNLSLWEKIKQIIKHPAVWRWDNA
jgi:DNA-directed RNA polymerase subunit RPC12/RpoP